MHTVPSPDGGLDTGDSDPTDFIRGIVSGLAAEQGGTELENSPDKATRRKQLEDGGIREFISGRAPSSDDGPHTPGEYEDRNFGPSDNASAEENDDGPYGAFVV